MENIFSFLIIYTQEFDAEFENYIVTYKNHAFFSYFHKKASVLQKLKIRNFNHLMTL